MRGIRSLASAFLVLAYFFPAALLGAGAAYAGGWPPMLGYGDQEMPLDQFFRTPDGGIAAPDAVAAAVGDVSYQVQCPNMGPLADGSDEAVRSVQQGRGVRITLSKSGMGYRDPAILNALLRNAAVAVFSQCSMDVLYQIAPGRSWTSYGIGFAVVVGSPADGAPQTVLAEARDFDHTMRAWTSVQDVEAAKEQQAAAAQAQQQAQAIQEQQAAATQQQQTTAEPVPAPQLLAANYSALPQRVKSPAELRFDQDSDYYWSRIKTFFWFIAFGWLGIWFIRHWEMFVRWYYELTPHPATDIVNAAVAGGVIDGNVFSKIMTPVPGNRIEREVRAEQARQLAELARETEAALRRRADEAQRQLREQAAFLAAQRDLHDATVNAQLAKARADLMERLAESLKRSAEAR